MKIFRARAPQILSLLLLIGIVFGFSIISHAADEQSRYTLLESVAGFKAKAVAPTFPEYLRSIFGYLIRAAGIAAVVMLVIAGVEYTASGVSEARKDDARKRINNVIVGLIGTISAYFLLSIINPNLVTFSLDIPPIVNKVPAAGSGNTGGSTPASRGTAGSASSGSTAGTASQGCDNCVNLVAAGIPVSSSANALLNSGLTDKLKTLAATLKSDWQVTEAFPPTVKHKSACHNDGTCLDINFASDKDNIQKINAFLAAAKAAGLRPIYEVQTDAEVRAVIGRGFTGSLGAGDIRSTNVTAPHFHVEDR